MLFGLLRPLSTALTCASITVEDGGEWAGVEARWAAPGVVCVGVVRSF